MKNKLKKFLIMVSIVAVCMLVFNSVFAVITENAWTETDKSAQGPISTMMKQSFSTFVTEPIVTALAVILKFFINIAMSVVAALFSLSGLNMGTSIYLPLPQHMIFNLIPMLDPNFINPTDLGSGVFNLSKMFSSILSPIYFSLVALAASTFLIIALVIGIKLVISISAQEKAQYKSALVTWITGLVLLFTGHFLMSGIFYINEQIVSNLYTASNEDLMIEIQYTEEDSAFEEIRNYILEVGTGALVGMFFGPIAGVFSAGAITALIENSQAVTVETVPGFLGIFTYYYQRMVYNSDYIATFAVAIVLGQIIALAILYVKRLVYALLLGILFPFVIVVDTYKKVAGQKSSGLFEKWLQQFSITIFMQSIHAFLFFLMIKMTNSITQYARNELGVHVFTLYDESENPSESVQNQEKVVNLILFIQVIVMASITRVENIIKDYLGVPDAKAGSLRSSGMLGYSAVKLGTSAVKNVADNFSGPRKVRKDVSRLRKKIIGLKEDNANAAEKTSSEASSAVYDEQNDATNSAMLTRIPTVKTNSGTPGPLADGKVDINDLGELSRIAGTDDPALVRIQNGIEKLISTIEKTSNGGTSATSSQDRLNRAGADPKVKTASPASDLDSKLELMDKKLDTVGIKPDPIEKLSEELREKERELSAKKVSQVASLGYVPLSLAMGIGMTSSLGDTASITAAMVSIGDKVSEAVGKNIPRAIKAPIINAEVNYEEYLQKKIVTEYSKDKYLKPKVSKIDQDIRKRPDVADL